MTVLMIINFSALTVKSSVLKSILIDLQIIMQTIMIAMEIYFRLEKQIIFRYLKKRLRCQKTRINDRIS